MENYTRSYIETIFSKISEKIAPEVYKMSINKDPPHPHNITTIGLIANLFAINSLKNRQIFLCIFVNSQLFSYFRDA